MKALLLLLTILTICTPSKADQVNLEDDFRKLDSVVAERNVYIKNKQTAIADYKNNFGQFVASIDMYNYNKHLFDEYLKLDADSALMYAERCLKIAEDGNLFNGKIQSQIDKVYITILQGDLLKAKILLDEFGPIDQLPAELRPRLAIAHLEFQVRLSQFIQNTYGGNGKVIQNPAVDDWKMYMAYLSNGWMTEYYEVLITGHGSKERLKKYLAELHQPSVHAAMLYIALAKLHQKEDDKKLYYHYLILSAINDIKSANREAQSLVYILQSPFLDKSTKRASEYAMACTENANQYKDKGRSLDVVTANAVIVKSYGLKLEQKERMMKLVIYLLAASVLFICFMLWLIMKKGRQRTKLLKRVEDMNRSLQAMMEESKMMQEKLKISNEKLEEEIKYRNSNFMDVYLLVSHYMKDMAAFKKAVFNMITTGKVDKARKELASTGNTEKYLQGFYAQFDKAFLVSHPDFVERFNTLLKPEFNIIPPAPDMLTPELRIYALVSIGITDSISIADFLHYSPQTIYNYRLGIRRNACIPEKIFAETVAKMYL